MQLSPGEQPKAALPSARRVGLILASVVIIAAPLFIYRENIDEYRLYLTEKRPAVEFRFDELSESWTERDLRQHFPTVRLSRDRSFDRHLDDRACFMDVESYNHVPAMFIAFFFASGKLTRASVNIPWWAHGTGYKALEFLYGKPTASQGLPTAGVRLHGWQLANGGAVFYNRDRPMNPLEWNAMFWSGPKACRENGCFIGK